MRGEAFVMLLLIKKLQGHSKFRVGKKAIEGATVPVAGAHSNHAGSPV